MTNRKSVLLVGETWYTVTQHIKGADHFTISEYVESGDTLIDALESQSFDVERIPCHRISDQFPRTVDAARQYDVILFSDVGFNSFVSPEIEEAVDLTVLSEFVKSGGGFGMIGGYMSFSGLQGRAAYHNTPVEDVLPVSIKPYDDRIERPSGVSPQVVEPDHPIADGLPERWPDVLGYHDVEPNDDATTIARCGTDPFLVAGKHGSGRSFAYLTDCEPEWPSEAMLEWDQYDDIWGNVAGWAAGDD